MADLAQPSDLVERLKNTGQRTKELMSTVSVASGAVVGGPAPHPPGVASAAPRPAGGSHGGFGNGGT